MFVWRGVMVYVCIMHDQFQSYDWCQILTFLVNGSTFYRRFHLWRHFKANGSPTDLPFAAAQTAAWKLQKFTKQHFALDFDIFRRFSQRPKLWITSSNGEIWALAGCFTEIISRIYLQSIDGNGWKLLFWFSSISIGVKCANKMCIVLSSCV